MRGSKIFSVVTEPSFALSVFRLEPPSAKSLEPAAALEQLNALNQALYARISSRSDILLTKTKLNDTLCIRFAIGAVMTTRKHIDQAWAILNEEAGVALKEWFENLEL